MKNLLHVAIHPFFRSISISICLLFSAIHLSGQYSLITQEPACLNFYNWAWAISDDNQGNTYLAGIFENSITLGSITLTSSGGGTAFIGKFNSWSNSWLWAKKIALVQGSGQSGYKRSEILDMTLDNTGNIYITGEYAGSVTFDNITLTSTKQGSVFTNDIFVAKLNSSGTFAWAKSFGSKAGADYSYTIALDASNNIYFGGFFTNKVGSCSGTNVEQRDVFLGKLNNAGTSLWQKRYASNVVPCGCTGCNISNNTAFDVAVDASGNAYLTGTYNGTMSFGNGPGMSITSVNGTNDAFTAKINSSGTTVWVKSEGGTTLDNGRAVYADAAGNVYTGGSAKPNAFTSKYNATGFLVWTVNSFPTSTSHPTTEVKSIIPYNNALLVYDLLIGFQTLSMADGSVVSTDSLVGNKVTGNFQIHDVETAGSGFAFTMNGDCGTVALDNLVFNASCTDCNSSCGSDDMLMVRKSENPISFSMPGEINVHPEFTRDELLVYPNPASDLLHLQFPELNEPATMIMYDLSGRVIVSQKVDAGNNSLNLQLDQLSLSGGVYYVAIQTGDRMLTSKVLLTCNK